MKQKDLMHEIERVVTKVLPHVPKGKAVEKKDFEVVLNKILACLHENTKIALDAIAQKTHKVISDLPNEYGRLPEDIRSWEALIGYLYLKYLKELGKL